MNRIKAKINNMSVVSKAALAFTLASVLERAVQMITGPIFTRLMTTEQYGTVTLFNSYAEIIGLFALLSLSSGIFNNGMLDFQEDRDSYIKSNLILSYIATGITLVSVVTIKLLFGNTIIPFNPIYLGVMFALFLVKPAYRFWLGRSKYEYNYHSVLIVSIVILLVSSLISVITTISFEDKSLGRIVGRDIAYFLMYSVFTISQIRKGKIKKKYISYAFRYTFPLLPYYLSKYILNHFDQVMIASMVDKSSAGIYSVAYTAGFAIKILWESINGATTPWIYQKLKDRKHKDIKRLTDKFFWFYCFMTLLVSLFAPEIMHILASSDYYEGVYCVAPVVVGVYYVGICGWFSAILFYNKRSKTLSALSIILGALNIGLNYYGIYLYGYQAAAYTTMICYMIQCAVMFFMANRLEKGAFNGKVTLLVSCITTVISIASMFLYGCYLIRYFIILLLVGASIYIYRRVLRVKKEY